MKASNKIGLRVGVSLVAGLLLALIMPPVMNAVWPYFQDSQYRPYPLAVLLANTVNLAPVIFCHFHMLPAALTFGENQSCYIALWYLNGPYYALVIFLAWSVLHVILIRRKRRNVQQ